MSLIDLDVVGMFHFKTIGYKQRRQYCQAVIAARSILPTRIHDAQTKTKLLNKSNWLRVSQDY